MPGATQSADFQFVPKVWQDHVDAYFRRKLVFGAFALQDRTLTAAPGETVNFPYFVATGAAEEPDEDQGLTVDKLQDNAFSATVKEVGKAVGVKMKALRKSAARRERIFSEIQSQIGQRMAEKVDSDLITEITTASALAFTGTSATTDKMNIQNLARAKLRGFGDRANEAVAVFMHSLQWEDMLTDGTAGFLKADANSPYAMIQGYQGMLLNMAVIVSDNVPAGLTIDSNLSYDAYIIKENAYGFMTAEDPEMERDKDILHREWVFAGTQWYAVKNFHAKIASDDLRIARMRTPTSVVA